MKDIIVNGKPCRVFSLEGRTPEPGEVVGQHFGRRVYRVLCSDGDDLIMRNVRNESIVVAMPRDEVIAEFGIVKEAQ